jgi:dephospho-CoA kinase
MSAIGITGGVATGKSRVSRWLLERLGRRMAVELFSADFEARRLTDSDSLVQEEIRSAFGAEVFGSDGKVARDRLRKLVFRDSSARKTLESILHPRIRQAWMSRVQEPGLLLAEIPLLYETDAEVFFDQVIVTACSRGSQLERLVWERNLPDTIASQMIDAQTPLEEKIQRADRVIWTDCPVAVTDQQLERLAEEILESYGGHEPEHRTRFGAVD